MPDSADDPVLEVEQLSVAYGSVDVLDRLDLPVRRGERLAVVGESASGKTTLATALVDGVPGPARVSGSVTYRPVDGDPVAVFDLDDDARQQFRRETVAVVSGDAGGFEPTRTVRSQFRPVLRTTGDGEERAATLLSAVGLDAERVLGARPGDLNRGAEQLTQVVRGVLADPAVLVLDALPVAVDHLARGDRLATLEAAARTGTDSGGEPTVVALGSELPALATLADRLAVLHDGHVVEVGPVDRVLDDPTHPHTRTLVEFYRGSR
ncbi:ATP-binding cassette domain-containing protein [Halosimplex salinum]|uniref:ATP-binding cassette domain-containing protein n=1 Tax=Halosimplex salinum TaxID=1710538 RepID=UPI000F4A41F9|nr:ATP-binding cassette domain-containing protein [Halosimplex salinum]